MSPTIFKPSRDGRYAAIVTTTPEARKSESSTLYVGGDEMDDGCVWVQIGGDDDDLGLIDPKHDDEEGVGVVYMNVDDAIGLAYELLDRVRKVRRQNET